MKCPYCEFEIQNGSVVFCTSCGERLQRTTGRRAALKQASVMFAIGIAMVPIWMFIGAAFPADDKLVESSPSTTWPEMVAWIVMWVMFIASATRVGYSLLFDRTVQRSEMNEPRGLPSADAFEVAAPGRWRVTTSDLKTKTPLARD